MKKQSLKALFQEYNSLPKSSQRSVFGRRIRAEKKRLVDECNYVDIVYILRFLGDYEKDRLFLDLLKGHPDSSLFVLAFANSDMHSYALASEMEKLDHDHDIEALQKDIELTFDEMLCKFLSVHGTKADFNFVQELADGAYWLESYKRALHGLSQLGNLQESDAYLSIPFFNDKKQT